MKKVEYIAVRGTIDKKNLSEDLDVHVHEDQETGLPFHEGFDAAADVLYADMKPSLKRDYET